MAIFKHLAVAVPRRARGLSHRFTNDFLLYCGSDKSPFACRVHSSEDFPCRRGDVGRLFSEFNNFSVYRDTDCVICNYFGHPEFSAAVIGLKDADFDSEETARNILQALAEAYELDPYKVPRRSSYRMYEEFIVKVADFCGCLTEIDREVPNDDFPIHHFSRSEKNSAFVAMALPTVALMYRRLSALRGFNFKLTFVEELPCLVFSARIIADGIGDIADIRELAFLRDLEREGGLKVLARLRECDGDEEPALCKLSVAVCPQTTDPRGILHAPAWKKRRDALLESLDLEVRGKF
ncbi:MAG: hypothetical protein ACI3XI_00850 [Eubacteriales bacterium]